MVWIIEPDDEMHRLRACFERDTVMKSAYANGVLPTVLPIFVKVDIDATTFS
jgi:hypothetical protein